MRSKQKSRLAENRSLFSVKSESVDKTVTVDSMQQQKLVCASPNSLKTLADQNYGAEELIRSGRGDPSGLCQQVSGNNHPHHLVGSFRNNKTCQTESR